MHRYLYSPLRAALAVGLLSVLACAANSARAQGILVVGDSISAAYGMSLEQGWVALMERQLVTDGHKTAVVNASISGETSEGGLRRLPQLLQQHQPEIVILELGGNDGLRGFPVKSLRANLGEMTRLSQAAGAAVILLPMEIPPNYGSRYTRAFRESYPQLAAETGSALAPFLLDGVATVEGMIQADGIHPTAAAQPRLLENVLPLVQQLLGSP